MVEQHADPVAQQVDRRLESGRKHQTGQRPQFRLVERFSGRTGVGGLDDLAEQVLAGVTPQLMQVVGQPALESSDARVDLLVLPPRESDVQAGRAELAERRIWGRSASGTPRMSLITATGSCAQYRPTMSTTPSPSIESSSSFAVSWTPSRSRPRHGW